MQSKDVLKVKTGSNDANKLLIDIIILCVSINFINWLLTQCRARQKIYESFVQQHPITVEIVKIGWKDVFRKRVHWKLSEFMGTGFIVCEVFRHFFVGQKKHEVSLSIV